MNALNVAVIVVYLVTVHGSGCDCPESRSPATDYFVGEAGCRGGQCVSRWWRPKPACSTVISVPGGAYTDQAFGNVETAVGYLIGRTVVAIVLIPL